MGGGLLLLVGVDRWAPVLWIAGHGGVHCEQNVIMVDSGFAGTVSALSNRSLAGDLS